MSVASSTPTPPRVWRSRRKKHGLLPLTQHAMRFTGRLAYHDYEASRRSARTAASSFATLERRNAMILRNHGPSLRRHRRRSVRPHLLSRARVAAQAGAMASGGRVIDSQSRQ
jgi:hypothetical protein